nr:histone deacetylase clr3 [Quercus suber]
MDVEEVGVDVLMHDGVLPSTEDTTAFSSTLPGGPFPDLKPEAPLLKGFGIKRELESYDLPSTNTHDQFLTGRIDAPRPPKADILPYASSQTGLVYDVRMRFHVETIPSEEVIHPEDPRRIHAIFEAFVDAGLAWRQGSTGDPRWMMGRIDTRLVTKEEVCLVHTEKHWEWIQSVTNFTKYQLEHEKQHPSYGIMDSVYLSPTTPYCAALSAGGAIEACRAVVLGKVKNVFAVIRPPGHHAEREDIKGFCFYDNVSIALKVCQAEFGEKCRKVLVLDWDVHHGNGIQQANYSDPNVLYISLHVHQDGNFYPERSYRDGRLAYGDHAHCGVGDGLGRNVNIPWRKTGMGDADYIYAFQQVVMPIGQEFDPDLVIIAAGFDAAEGDMLGGCHVSPAGYAHMTHMLMSLAEGKVAVCLEGGYNLVSIARSATAVARTLMGEPPERLHNLEPTTSGVDVVKLVVRQQSKFWSCLHPKDPNTRLSLSGPQQEHGERMHDVVRKWQALKLWEEYEMVPLFIRRAQISQSFEDQVLATPNYAEARPLLVILHDAPEMIASPDPRTGKIELHNTWVTYIDWAVQQGFAVIDVNLPKYITGSDDSENHEETEDAETRTAQTEVLLKYLWENYIELNDSTHVFLMGTNTGHGAIVNFIRGNEQRAQARLTRAISMVQDVAFMSVRSPTNDMLANWYYAHSLVFVAHEHSFWTNDHKIRKRFGRLKKSSADNISEMLANHKEAVFADLLQDTQDWVRPTEEDMAVPSIDHISSPSTPNGPLPPVKNFASPHRSPTKSSFLQSPK